MIIIIINSSISGSYCCCCGILPKHFASTRRAVQAAWIKTNTAFTGWGRERDREGVGDGEAIDS